VATDLLTHTQVLDRDIALLVPPDGIAFASALSRLLQDPVLRRRLGSAAAERAAARYSRDEYVSRTREVCERLALARPPLAGATARTA
jgi:glycosyltransferase involved in cell wall biosynthesis